MSLYSIVFLDASGHVIGVHAYEARDIWQALAHANRRLSLRFKWRGQKAIDPHGRVDVLDHRGTTVGRIPCADAIAAMT